jgi:transposase-like protein
VISLVKRLELQTQRNWQLHQDNSALRGALHQSRQLMAGLEKQLVKADEEIKRLEGQLAAHSKAFQDKFVSPVSTPAAAALPPFVKPEVAKKQRKVPGRKAGHEPAHRPLPSRIDMYVEVPVGRDASGHASCPECRTQLSKVREHDRIVEDITTMKVDVTCYRTTSGYCPSCRKVIESRDSRQPPVPAGVDLPQGQLGLNTLATAAMLRMIYRLPYRQISGLFSDMSDLKISSSCVADQIQRMGLWLEGQYDRLKTLVQLSPVVHMDETSWRVDGKNHWLWTMLSKDQTVFHIDKSRGNKAARELLGEAFSGTLVSDFYGAYNKLDCAKQKCLAHLLRELKETSEKHPSFAGSFFARRARRLVKEMFLLKPWQTSLTPEVYQSKGRKLERRVLELGRKPSGTEEGMPVSGVGWDDPHVRRLSKRLRRYGPELTCFLWSEQVDPTNNAAERALRPAVIARKISGGSRSERGAKAGVVLLSIFKSAQQQRCPLLETIRTLLRAHWDGKNPAVLTDILQRQETKGR